MKTKIAFCLVLLISTQILAQEQPKPMTNQDVIDLVALGIGDDVIVEKIQSASTTSFDTSIDALKTLKAAKVSDAVMKAMVNPRRGSGGRIVDELASSYKNLQNGVVTVWSEFGQGTGFIVSKDGLVLTNQHVVGPSEYLALQFDAQRKIPATLLAADPEKDVAVLWANFKNIPEAIPLEIAKVDELNPSLIEGERVFTIGSPLNQQKVITSGIVSKINRTAIISDVNINHGNSGGPLFNSQGKVVGITTFGDWTTQGGPGISGILRIEEAKSVIDTAQSKITAGALHPTSDLLPVDPTDPYPIDAIKSLLLQDKFDYKPYFFSEGDYQVSVITPPLKYYAERESGVRAAKEKSKRNRKSATAVQDTFRPLDDLKNWEQYVGEYKSVLIIRASPKLKETTGSIFLRSLAASGGSYGVPAKMRFKTDFYRMKLMCGAKEIEPILPGKIASVLDVKNGLVNVTDATYQGFYSYPADAISPSCGKVTLQLYSEKKPESAVTKELSDKTVSRIWEDFAPYLKNHTAEKTDK